MLNKEDIMLQVPAVDKARENALPPPSPFPSPAPDGCGAGGSGWSLQVKSFCSITGDS